VILAALAADAGLALTAEAERKAAGLLAQAEAERPPRSDTRDQAPPRLSAEPAGPEPAERRQDRMRCCRRAELGSLGRALEGLSTEWPMAPIAHARLFYRTSL
jgi:hypothetical protein